MWFDYWHWGICDHCQIWHLQMASEKIFLFRMRGVGADWSGAWYDFGYLLQRSHINLPGGWTSYEVMAPVNLKHLVLCLCQMEILSLYSIAQPFSYASQWWCDIGAMRESGDCMDEGGGGEQVEPCLKNTSHWEWLHDKFTGSCLLGWWLRSSKGGRVPMHICSIEDAVQRHGLTARYLDSQPAWRSKLLLTLLPQVTGIVLL
jgi:hypothetical protein